MAADKRGAQIDAVDTAAPALRIRCHGLAAADEQLVRLYVNLQARGQAPDWVLSPERADMVLWGADAPLSLQPAEEVIIVTASSHRPPTGPLRLRSPLQYDDLHVTLMAAAAALRAGERVGTGSGHEAPAASDFVPTVTGAESPPAASGFASTLSEARTLDTAQATSARLRLARLAELERLQRELAARSQLDAAGPAPGTASTHSAPVPEGRPAVAVSPATDSRPSTRGDTARPAVSSLPDPALGLRLVRWPSRATLAGDTGHARLAGFWATRPMSCAELARLSGASLSTCVDLAHTLMAQGCLVVNATAPTKADTPPGLPAAATETTTPNARTPAAAQQQPPRAKVSHGFISRLRQRFGLS